MNRRLSFSQLCCLFVAVLVILATAQTASAEAASKSSLSSAASATGESFGIAGHYRSGQWTAVRLPASVKANVQIETTDGDGISVVYQQNFIKRAATDEQSPSQHAAFGYCIPGTEAAPLIIRSGDASPTIDVQSRFPESGVPADGPSMIPLTMPWIVSIGDPLGIETIGVNELLKRNASIAVSRIERAETVPDHVLGFSGVDMIIITASGTDVLENLSAMQGAAIGDWVRGGGRLFVTLGANAKKMLDASEWLAALLPEEVIASSVVRMEPSGFESFTNSQSRLSNFDGWQLPKMIGAGGTTLSSVGEVMIAGRTTRKIGLPLVIRYTAGMGKITLVAADLDEAPFVEWDERIDLVTKLCGELLVEDRSETGSSFRLSGYSDLSGQVRRSLDRFPIKRSFSFSIIALIIAALIAIVAPLDYFLVRRVLGNPLLGWLTFPIVAVLLSVALVLAAAPSSNKSSTALLKPSQATLQQPVAASDNLLRANAIELLDIDSATQTGRLFRWSYLYSHPAQIVQVASRQSDALGAIVDKIEYQMLHPFGTPGQLMGGIQIDGWSAPIEVPVSRPEMPTDEATTDVATADDGLRLLSRIESLELAPRSSKSLALQMQFQTSLQGSTVQRRKGSELLQGQLVNPFEVDLLDAMLIYQNWAYFLPTRFPARATVKELDRLRQKNFRWQLSRQRALESSSQTEAWDVTQANQPERLAEMLMFHGVVGGVRYTGLQNQILGHLDMTSLLTADRCILVGRCRDPWIPLEVTSSIRAGDTAATLPPGDTHSWVRIVLPVEEVRR